MRHMLGVLLMACMCEMIKSIPSCKPNQMMRKDISGNNICCYTLLCRQGQTFGFCEHDQSFDTCSDCPEGTYHLDTIDTSKMNTELDPCISKPTCEQPEVRLENGKCICDRSRGYYGNDIYNCMLAEMMCSSPGFELKENGKCEPCAEDFFKPEASAEYNCKRKSSCHVSQDIASNGSTTIDRSCKAKIKINLPAIKLTTENNIDNNDKNNNQSTKEQQNYDVYIGIIIGIIVVAIILVVVIIVNKTCRDKPLQVCLCIRTWSDNCHIYEKASNDVDNNKTYNEIDRLSSRSISNTYEEACVLMSGITENNDVTSHYDNTSTKEKHVSTSKEEIRKPHLAEVHSSFGTESFPECSTDRRSSVAHEEFTELISGVKSTSPCKPIQIDRTKHSPQKIKSISHDRHEKTAISDKNRINVEYSDKNTLTSSDNEQIELQSTQILIHPHDVSSSNMSVEMTLEGEYVCREKTYKKLNVEDAQSTSKRKTFDNAGKSDKKEHSKYENMPRKNARTRTRQLENTAEFRQFRNTQTKTLSKKDKTTQSRVNDPLNIIEDDSIADPYTQKRTDFLRHVHEEGIDNVNQPNLEEDRSSTFNLKNKQLPIIDKNPTTNIIPSVATVKPRLRRKEKDPNNQWTTREHHLAVTQPDNQDVLRKVATSRAPRPSESEMSNNVHSGSSSDTSQAENSNESSENSRSSTFDPGEETALKYLPPVDSIDF